MRQLTIRGFDLELEQAIRNLARREGLSLNKAALRLLRKGAEVLEESEPAKIGSRLDRYAGIMDENEAAELLDSLAQTRRVDPELWR